MLQKLAIGEGFLDIFNIYFKFKQIFNFWCYLSISILCYIEVFNRRTLM